MDGAELLNARLAGGGQGEGFGGLQRDRRRRQGDRPFLVGGIAPIGAGQDEILAGLGGDHELLTGGTADRPAVGLDGHGPQTAALEDASVGPVHRLVGAAQAGLVRVEGVGVLHDELPAPHQAEAGPDLITELGLDLIQADRQLAVGAQQVGRQLGHHLFVGGAEPQGTLLAVNEVKHDSLPGGVAVPAAAAAPEIGGLELGKQGLEGVDGDHLLPDDRGDLLKHPPEQGQVGEDSGRQTPHVAGPEQELVGGDLRFGRIVAKRHQHQAGDAHGERPFGRWTLSPQRQTEGRESTRSESPQRACRSFPPDWTQKTLLSSAADPVRPKAVSCLLTLLRSVLQRPSRWHRRHHHSQGWNLHPWSRRAISAVSLAPRPRP